MNFFWGGSRPMAGWVSAGLASSFLDVGDDECNLIAGRLCDVHLPPQPGCKIFHVPKEDSSQASEVDLEPDTIEMAGFGDQLKDQVVVFKYRNKFHAVDHQCPHSAYPLSNGTPFDIEDFGVVLSAGLLCPKHGWAFDLFTGNGDRGNYKLPIWEVQLRDAKGKVLTDRKPDGSEDDPGMTVWIRRKQRIG